MNDNIVNNLISSTLKNILVSISDSVLEMVKPTINDWLDGQFKEAMQVINSQSEVHSHLFERIGKLEDRLGLVLAEPSTSEHCSADLKSLEDRIKTIEETMVDQGELEDKVAREIEDYDFDEKVSEALDDYDLSDKVNDCIRDYDFSSIVSDELDNQDLVDADAVRDILKSEISDLRIVQG
jgi:hypothetical protein